MSDKSQKFKSEVWNFFQIVEGGDKTKCRFCETKLSYKSNSTKSMWDHVKSKHSFEMADEKKSVSQKFGSVMKQSKLNFGEPQKFSREKQEMCFKAAAEVCHIDDYIKIYIYTKCKSTV